MTIENLNYLQQALKYLGFGDQLGAALESASDGQESAFQLKLCLEFNQEPVNYVLDFKISDTHQRFFFHRYQATLCDHVAGWEKSQLFFIHRHAGFTAKEAYNLLCGRSVQKDLISMEGKTYSAWVQLDFSDREKNGNFKTRQYHEGYGYNLEELLSAFPIAELQDPVLRPRLIRSLKKGNIQPFTLGMADSEKKIFLAAEPRYKTFQFFDGQQKRTTRQNLGLGRGDQPGTSSQVPDLLDPTRDHLPMADSTGIFDPLKPLPNKAPR
ncbi:MAG: hypothetical protein ACYCOO_01250 [Chitinophagaceae bacterium]